jgi:hypothetical protein
MHSNQLSSLVPTNVQNTHQFNSVVGSQIVSHRDLKNQYSSKQAKKTETSMGSVKTSAKNNRHEQLKHTAQFGPQMNLKNSTLLNQPGGSTVPDSLQQTAKSKVSDRAQQQKMNLLR